MNRNKRKTATLLAVAAAALYAVNIPLSKLLLDRISSTMLAAFLYLGAGIGMGIVLLCQKAVGRSDQSEPLARKELPYTVAMVLLDIAAPILLMAGIARTGSTHVSLLNNFEIVATSLIALIIFREVISRKLWIAIGLIVAASLLLSFEGTDSLSFNEGSLLALDACLCWGFENNCTRKISNKNAKEIVFIKGIGSGLGSLLIALFIGDDFPSVWLILAAFALGFVAYGLSILCYILAQKDLGAAKTSAYYSIAPFLGVLFGILLLGERPGLQFFAALTLMIVATVLIARDTVSLQHEHLHTHTHTHAHRHGDLVHTHPHEHTHTHSHVHTGEETAHTHSHDEDCFPDHIHSHT
ncbi:MAG: DMT family transporter [Eubacteriales bacterium]